MKFALVVDMDANAKSAIFHSMISDKLIFLNLSFVIGIEGYGGAG
jgi:hypothetical protein